MKHASSLGLVCVYLFLGATGCAPKTLGNADQTYDRLMWIGEAYMKATDELGRPPANRDDLAPFLKDRGSLDEVFTSDKDKEPFVLYWNVDYRAYENEKKPYPVTAHEKTGKDGIRYVLTMRVISQLREEDIKTLAFPPGVTSPF